MEHFLEKCKHHSLKITPQRAAIYKVLMGSQTHPSADVIHKEVKKEFPNISIDTVNRTLLTFANIGIIDVVEGEGDPRRFDPNLKKHHHFYCINCRKIFDIFNAKLDQLDVPVSIEKQYTILTKRIVLRGYCHTCK